MKCLSLWQPWASLLVGGEKKVETRGWPIHHRGPLLIHAAKRWTPDEGMVAGGPVFRAALRRLGFGMEADEDAARQGWGLPFGAIVGCVDVVECVPTERAWVEEGATARRFGDPAGLMIGSTEWAFGDYSEGRFALLCRNPIRFDNPIPFRGSQGLFDVPAATVAGELPAGVPA